MLEDDAMDRLLSRLDSGLFAYRFGVPGTDYEVIKPSLWARILGDEEKDA